ncbi:hypothetical protein H2200_008216 [Cladophialophora chaetospira]|uniref:Clr5 domain-containing protein n=1 Tax=Cladophialophora chaetospira TaxID=386627 RepID=A0AA38X5F6_9EURO|nr:hypothetical protein H2200_008216 [Cladophialophora chaetospira]
MATTNGPRARQKAPSSAEWDRIKPIFEHLYIRENLKLPKISAILAEHHSFHAAPHMYKHRISQWGFKKNFKLEELEVVASTASHFVRAGLTVPTAIIGEREVPIERAKRHFRTFFQDDIRNQSSSMTPVAPSRQQQYSACPNRHSKRRLTLQRRSLVVPRIILQQSEKSHLLESTLAAVNNYYGWRLTRDQEEFIAHTHGSGAGDQLEAATPLSPASVFDIMIDGLHAAEDGAHQFARVSLQDFCRQTRILLAQQHHSLLGSLISMRVRTFSGIAGKLHDSVVSHLRTIARRLLPPTHPIPMILKLLECHEETTTSSRLLLKVMCEIAGRQNGMHAGTIVVLEYQMVETSVNDDEFDVALELCESLLQRYINRFDERHRSCRRALYLMGYLKYKYDMNDEAEEILLRVLKMDDFDEQVPENADWISIRAMEVLGWIYEESRELSAAEMWLSRAHAASCQYIGSDEASTQGLLHQFNQLRRRSHLEEGLSVTSEEDGAGFLEELEEQLAQVGLEEPTECGSQSARDEPWSVWERDIQCSISRSSVPQTRRRRHSFVSGSISGAEDEDEDEDEDLTAGGSESCADSEPVLPRDSDPSGLLEQHGGEKSSSTHEPAQYSFHADGAGDIVCEERHFAKFDVNDGSAVAPIAMVEDPRTLLFQPDIAEFQDYMEPMEPMDANQFNFSQFDIDGREPFDGFFDGFLMDLDLPNNFEVVDNQSQEHTVSPTTISALALEPFATAGEQDMSFGPLIETFESDNLDSTEMLVGSIDPPTRDVSFSEDVDTIDPKLIFCSSSGRGHAF